MYSSQLQDPNNNVIAFVRPTRPTRYQGVGDVYAELHFVRSAGAGVVVCPTDLSPPTSLTTDQNATDASSTHGHCHGDGYAVPVCLGIQPLMNVSISDYLLH